MGTGRLGKLNYVEGDTLSPSELGVRFGIPREEIGSFHQCIRVYLAGEPIINEGEDDHTLFLLRSGQVGVYKKSSENKQELLGTVEAVNFVGEMALINEGPRSATVIATKGEVLVYAISRPNLGLIFANPKWAELLIARLAKNLARANDSNIQSARRIDDLQRKVDQLQSQVDLQQKQQESFHKNISKTIATLFFFEQAIQDLAVHGSRSWTFLKLFRDVSQNLFDRWVPSLQIREEDINYPGLQSALRVVGGHTPGGIPAELQDWMGKYIENQEL